MEKLNIQLDRRSFVNAALASGFALAVLPLAASAITTDTNGIKASDVFIPVGKEKIPAYQAHPEGNGPFSILIISHEIFGVHEHIRDVCRRFAKLGFFAIAPNLYSRHGDVTKIKEISDILSQVVSKVKLEEVLKDLDATVAYLKKDKKADSNHLNITGFCWGGRTAWLYANHNPKIKSAIAWYGPLVGTTPSWPIAPVDIAANLKVPVLGIYGGQDKNITIDHVKQMEEGLNKGKSGSKIIVYSDAQHGFFADYRPSYNEKDAQEGLKEMLEWIKSHNT